MPPTFVPIQRNPMAGARQRRRELLELVRELKARGFVPRLFRQRDRLTAWMADDERRARVRCLIAAGGDGTINDLLTRFPGVPLAVLPLGTENLLATLLQIPISGRAVAEMVAAGTTRCFDVGRLGTRQFVMCAGVGVDAAVIQAVHDARQGHITKWHYVWPALRLLAGRRNELVLRDDAGNEHRGSQILIFNHPRYALGLRWAPDAVGDDGWLDVRVLTRGTWAWTMRYLWCAWRGVLSAQPGVTTLRIRRATITSAEPVAAHVDGDPAGVTPIDVEVLPQRLTLILPRALH
jgi:YegS/Rv2252/BmrU family lipid kinase